MSSPLTGTLRLPPRIHVGYGSRAQIPGLVALHGRRVLAVVDPYLPGTPLLDETLAALADAGLVVQVYSDIRPELPVDSLEGAGEVARNFAPDVILAIGGGSALDAAKLIGLLAAHGGPLSAYYGENAVPAPTIPLVAVPTTAGTGSEATPVAVVSDPDRELKVGISSPYLVPAAAVVDPEFVLGAPDAVMAYSGIDALVHLVESYTAAPLDLDWSATLPVFTGRNVFAEAMTLDAASRIATWLPRAVADSTDRDAVEQVAYGSLVGGMSFGPTGTHLSHALQYPIGAMTHTPHGLGTGLMLPYVLDACRGGAADRIAAIGVALGSPAEGAQGRVDDAIDAIVRINAAIGIPASLSALGLDRDDLPRIAELAQGSARLLAIAPQPQTHASLLAILEDAFTGRLTERSTT